MATNEDEEKERWAKQQIEEWREAAKANAIIYTMGFVSSDKLEEEKKSNLSLISKLYLALLTLVSLIIQTVVPVAIAFSLETPDGVCPNKADPLAKIIGLALCLFFVVLTISMCLSKLRGMGFLKLFCSSEIALLGCNRFFLELGIISNLVSMAGAGVCQYILFIRNANNNYVLLVLQSLAMQFVLSPDQKLMTGSTKAWTIRRLKILMQHELEAKLTAGSMEEGVIDDLLTDSVLLKKVKLMYIAEASFLACVSIVGMTWSVALTYCM